MQIHNAAVTGSFIYNGIDISDITGSEQSVVSLNEFSASILNYTSSNNEKIAALNAATASLYAASSSLYNFSASILSYTSSTDAKIAQLNRETSSLNFATASINNATASLYNATASINSFSASILNYTSSNNNNIAALYAATASLYAATASIYGATSSLFNYSASSNLRIGSLEQYTASLNTRSASFACVDATNNFACAQYFSNTSNAISFTSTGSLYSDGGMRITKDLYVSGTSYFNNVTVFGTQSINYITSSQLNIASNLITVNTSTPAVRFGGLAVYDSGSLGTGLTGSLLWDSENNHWVYSNPSGSSYSGGMFISGPRSAALGSEQGTTACMLLVGQGGDHLTSSMIYHSSTTTCIPNTLIGNTVSVGTITSVCSVISGTPAQSSSLLLENFNGDQTATTLKLKSGRADVFYHMQAFSSNTSEVFRIESSGRVVSAAGACFASAVCVPNIISTGTSGGRYATFNAPTNGGYITFEAGGTPFGDLGSYCAQYGTGDATTLLLGSRTGYALSLGTNSTERLRITCAGNVGIGTSTPATKLHVSNNGAYGIEIDVANEIIQAYNRSTSDYNEIKLYSSNLRFFNGGSATITERMRITSGGDVLVGATSRVTGLSGFTQFEVSAVEGGITINSNCTTTERYSRLMFTKSGATGNEGLIRYNVNDYHMSLWTNANERLRITCAGIACFACQVCAPTFLGSTATLATAGTACTVSGVLTLATLQTGGASVCAGAAIVFEGNAGATVARIYSRGNMNFNNGSDLVFQTQVSAGGTPQCTMVINGNSQSVGIGTFTPTDKLDIYGNDTIGAIVIRGGSSQTGRNIYLFSGGINATGTLLGVTKCVNQFIYANNSRLTIGTADAHSLGFSTSDTLRAIIDSSGIACFACQVCAPSFISSGTICTTTADGKNLDIGGVAVIRGNGSAYTTHYFTTGAVNVAKYLQYNASGVAVNQMAIDAHTYFNSGCNFGIGTTSPSEKLTVYGAVIRLEGAAGVSPFAIANNNSTGFRIYDYNAGLDRMVITSGGVACFGGTIIQNAATISNNNTPFGTQVNGGYRYFQGTLANGEKFGSQGGTYVQGFFLISWFDGASGRGYGLFATVQPAANAGTVLISSGGLYAVSATYNASNAVSLAFDGSSRGAVLSNNTGVGLTFYAYVFGGV